MTLCPIIQGLWNLFSPNCEQNAILRVRNPVRHHFKMLINQPRVCPFSATVFKICFPLLSLLIASPQQLLSCGCAKQWLGTRISLASLSWIQPRLCWGMGGEGGLLSPAASDLSEEPAQSSSSAQEGKMPCARYWILAIPIFSGGLTVFTSLVLAFPDVFFSAAGGPTTLLMS